MILCLEKLTEIRFDLAENSTLVKAVSDIFTEVFYLDITTVNLITSDSSNNSQVQDFKNQLTAKSFTSSKAIIRQDSSNNHVGGQVKKFSIFIVNDLKELQDVFTKISAKIFKFNGFYLIVIIGDEVVELQKIFELFWNLQIFNLNIIYESSSNVVEVKTFMPFGAKKCNDMTPILINQYKDGEFINGVKDFFPDKVKNLYKCPIRVAVFNKSEPSVFVKHSEKGDLEFSGSDINMVKALAQNLNFKINYTLIEFNAFYCESLNASIPFKSTFNGQAEMSVSYWLLKVKCLETFDATTSYATEKIIFLIPPGRDYSFFEKLIYPFDFPLWGMIMACFFVGMLIIFVISRRSKFVQNLVFGDGVTNPYLNMFIGFIGGSQSTLPKMNFARFLLMVLLIYCLVIRSLYQGSFFELLHSSKHYKEVQSIDEMIAKDFTFYAQTGIAGLFYGSETIKSRFAKFLFKT